MLTFLLSAQCLCALTELTLDLNHSPWHCCSTEGKITATSYFYFCFFFPSWELHSFTVKYGRSWATAHLSLCITLILSYSGLFKFRPQQQAQSQPVFFFVHLPLLHDVTLLFQLCHNSRSYQRRESARWLEVLLHEPVWEVQGTPTQTLEDGSADSQNCHDHHTSTCSGSETYSSCCWLLLILMINMLHFSIYYFASYCETWENYSTFTSDTVCLTS